MFARQVLHHDTHDQKKLRIELLQKAIELFSEL